MKNRLITALARLASQDYQEQYIVHGTVDEYVLPEDLVEDAASLCELAKENRYRKFFNDAQLKSVEGLLLTCRQFKHSFWADINQKDVSYLIYKDLKWSNLRAQANRCLKELNTKLEDVIL